MTFYMSMNSKSKKVQTCVVIVAEYGCLHGSDSLLLKGITVNVASKEQSL